MALCEKKCVDNLKNGLNGRKCIFLDPRKLFIIDFREENVRGTCRLSAYLSNRSIFRGAIRFCVHK